MKLFNLFRKPPIKENTREQSFEEFMTDLRAKRMEETKLALSMGAVSNPPAGFTHFDLNNVIIGKGQGDFIYYLFDEKNTDVLSRDIQTLNNFAYEANALVQGLPDFSIDISDVAIDPFPDNSRQQWFFSWLIIEGLTETGRMKKYPVAAHVETITGEKTAKLFYTLDGIIRKGWVVVHLFPNTSQFVSYGFDFINGVVSHVWENTENGKAVLYNKNNGSL